MPVYQHRCTADVRLQPPACLELGPKLGPTPEISATYVTVSEESAADSNSEQTDGVTPSNPMQLRKRISAVTGTHFPWSSVRDDRPHTTV